MATSCFFHRQRSLEDDSVVLFSASNSPDESTSPSSSFSHSPPRPPHRPSKPARHDVTVKNLSYRVHPRGGSSLATPWSFGLFHNPEPVDILNSVSFVARNTEILAVVGPSGTGKSTLIRILAGRVKDQHFDPKCIFIDHDQVTSPARLRRECGFVAQEDNLIPLLTVKETLMYSAKFRLRGMSQKEREERVGGLMQELGLTHAADTFVGDEENRGISGGERKRVSIGVDMIHDPPILLLDEPTSGLDSKSALQVIELLSLMAKAHRRTIIISIHQPSYRILGFISNYLILYRGSVVHSGSIGSLEERIAKLGLQVPLQLNVLEFAMEILSPLETSYRQGHSPALLDKETLPCSYPMWPVVEIRRIVFLCSRFWKIIYRTKQLLLARTMQALVGGFGLGSVYINVRKNEGGVTERLGLFAFSLSFLLSSTVEALPIYLQERRVLMKESSRGAYRISSYMVANTIVFLPFLFAVAFLFAVPVYWIVGLNPSIGAFAFFTFIVWVIVLMASSLVLFLSAVSPDFISGNSLICTVLGAFFLFSGYFIPKESIPKYWLFMYYVSLYRYPLDALLTNEYWSLRSEGLDKDTRWINVGIMFGFFMLYRVLCWLILVRRATKTTK
ncbi:ABC transporter domain-containing protein [Psidium guajava]|nr:ABC transporter domain-containing protein [Psidium guajava]